MHLVLELTGQLFMCVNFLGGGGQQWPSFSALGEGQIEERSGSMVLEQAQGQLERQISVHQGHHPVTHQNQTGQGNYHHASNL